MKKKKILKSIAVAIPVLAFMMMSGGVVQAQSGNSGRFGQNNLSETQKEVILKVRELRQSGKFDEADALAGSSGLSMKRIRKGFDGDKGFNFEERLKIRQAIENNDYATFKTLTSNLPFAEKINESSFSQISKAHNLKMQGDDVGAKAIMDQLGFRLGRGPQNN